MGVNSLGYRGWRGKLAPPWSRVIIIARTGIRRAWTSRWLRRLLFFAWLPTLVFAFPLFCFERSQEYPDLVEPLAPFVMTRIDNPALEEAVQPMRSGDTDAARHGVWSWLLQTFFRYPQGVTMALIIGMVAPPLISQDIRSRAFLLYFSRPINRFEYILGKLGTIWAYLAMITMFPALSLYAVGILLSPNVGVINATWDIPIRIVIASAVLAIPTASLALCLSSMTQESRNATFAWFAIWIMGWVTYSVMGVAHAVQQGHHGHRMEFMENSRWSYFSLYHTLGRVQSWVFGFSELSDILGSAIVLVAITVVSLVVLSRRVVAPMRA